MVMRDQHVLFVCLVWPWCVTGCLRAPLSDAFRSGARCPANCLLLPSSGGKRRSLSSGPQESVGRCEWGLSFWTVFGYSSLCVISIGVHVSCVRETIASPWNTWRAARWITWVFFFLCLNSSAFCLYCIAWMHTAGGQNNRKSNLCYSSPVVNTNLVLPMKPSEASIKLKYPVTSKCVSVSVVEVLYVTVVPLWCSFFHSLGIYACAP